MVSVGIEAMNAFTGTCFVSVDKLAKHRGLDMARFDNLMMNQKSVAIPHEDPVTFGINAAKPIIDSLSPEERDRIEMVITATESAFDFGKSMSTYFHHYLGLNRNCRLFEIKNACYSGVGALQTAVNFVMSQASPGAKVLVIASDISRFLVVGGGDALSEDWSFAEPSAGAGAVAMLIGEQPDVFQLDFGANGYYGYEVMDTCRPVPDSEAGDADLSLLSFLDCCQNTFLEYRKRVPDADYVNSFGYMAYHTPFGGMVKGAHRKVMRTLQKASPADIDADFEKRVTPGLVYCQRVGNIMGATAALSLLSTIENADLSTPQRIGCFSYGSGCSSEFFSGVATQNGQEKLRSMNVRKHLDSRYELSMDEYNMLLNSSHAVKFGTRNVELDWSLIPNAQKTFDSEVLFLRRINEYHREYEWV